MTAIAPQPGEPEPDDGFLGARTVRPYAVTGGRTGPTSAQLPVEALVSASPSAVVLGLTSEQRRVVELTRDSFLTIAELSAHTCLPVGVIRVVVSDLSDAGTVRLHGLTDGRNATPVLGLQLLESVLDGISSL